MGGVSPYRKGLGTKLDLGRTKFTTSGAHDVIAITSPQKNDLCTEELRDRAQVMNMMKLPGHWTRSVYHLEEL